MSLEGTTVISVVVLQSSMDLLNGEHDSSNESCVTSTHDGKVTSIEAERFPHRTDEEDEVMTIPVIKTEPNVSCVSVVSVTHFLWAIFSIAFPYINVSL
jgi:hypothetical protein